MSIVGALFLTMILVFPSEVLVLRNGKTMTCDRFEREAGRVTIFRGSQKFTLPDKLIDWQASELETKRRAAAEERVKKAEADKKAEITEAEPREKKTITLTQREYQKLSKPRVTGKTTISYRKLGNTILVRAGVNRGVPVDFVLDTGASVTLISPNAAADWDVTYTSDQAQLIGVGGQEVGARYCILEEVDLGGARVENLKAVVRAIPQLNELHVVGLLGQDFLNHFIVNLNSANQTLTLTPHGAGHLNAEQSDQFAALLRDPNKPFLALNQLVQKLETYYKRFMLLTEPLTRNSDMSDIKKIVAELPRIRDQINRVHNALSTIPSDQISDAEKENMKKFLECYPRFGNVMTEVSQFSQMLRKAYSNARDESSLLGMQNMLADGWLEAVRSIDRFRACW